MVYHASADPSAWQVAGSMSILPLNTSTRGPAPVGQAPDIVDEALNYFRANVLYKKYEITNGAADRLLVYLTLVVSQALRALENCKTKAEGVRAMHNLSIEQFTIPGDPGFPLTGLFAPPANREEADLLRAYLKQCREEVSLRIVDFTYNANGSLNKFWMAFSKRKFMNVSL